MTIYKDCYETTVGQAHVTKPIVIAIKEAMIKDALGHNNLHVNNIGSVKPVFITGGANHETQIPLFAHPITIKISQSETYMCADVRFFVRKDTPLDNIEKSIKNITEFNFTKSRLILSMLWQDNQANRMKNGLQFAGIVYAAWLSETISKNFALDFKDQTTLNIISHYFYQSLFLEEDLITPEDKERMAVQTIKATRAPAEFVLAVFDKIHAMTGIEDYCIAVSTILENVRLKQFNVAILLTIVKSSWYGTNAKEIISVALEHPPTWIAIVWTSLYERTFKSSLIARISERFGKRGASDEFNSNYIAIVRENIATEEQSNPSPYRALEI
jgi:hypothetical protein